ncbi:hypothetical protein LTR66_000536 [Elasticomyces elasticus]|nr:hypothetical protein LTR66_000536 [Elasticomyces elasticus]
MTSTKSSLKDSIQIKSISDATDARNVLVFVITGNPGLIEYYRPFCTALLKHLTTSKFKKNQPFSEDTNISIYGHSLAGFELGDADDRALPLDLEQQIAFVEARLDDAAKPLRSNADGRRKNVEVVLIGHSVGAYILLEILRRRRERATDSETAEQTDRVKIVQGICLFPTVTHIARSKSGRKFTWLLTLPYFALLASFLAKAFTFWVPPGALQYLVGIVTGFPPHATAATAAFIQSKHGVRQALHMAKHEMQTITEDRWDAELWDTALATSTSAEKPKLFFYFGESDHWVADETRDTLIAARAATDVGTHIGRPVMEIDTKNIPHGFCIGKHDLSGSRNNQRRPRSDFETDHSEQIAEKVVEYIREVAEAD